MPLRRLPGHRAAPSRRPRKAHAHRRAGGSPRRLPESIRPYQVVGRLHARPDAVEKVTGAAVYTDDLHFPRHAARAAPAGPWSRMPSSRRSMSTKPAALPGVAAVLTAEDIPGEHNHGLVISGLAVLVGVGERVRYVGDAVAIVAAETREIAAQALDLIEVEFELAAGGRATRCRRASRAPRSSIPTATC